MSTASLLVNLLLGGFGVTALTGAIVAYKKLPSEMSSAAVLQSQGAMEVMRQLNDSLIDEIRKLEKSRDYYRRRAIRSEHLLDLNGIPLPQDDE